MKALNKASLNTLRGHYFGFLSASLLVVDSEKLGLGVGGCTNPPISQALPGDAF